MIPPLSLVQDDLGIYYDPTRESCLERLIAQAADSFVGELNARIDAYNAGTSWDPIDRLDAAELLETWAAVRRRLAD